MNFLIRSAFHPLTPGGKRAILWLRKRVEIALSWAGAGASTEAWAPACAVPQPRSAGGRWRSPPRLDRLPAAALTFPELISCWQKLLRLHEISGNFCKERTWLLLWHQMPTRVLVPHFWRANVNSLWGVNEHPRPASKNYYYLTLETKKRLFLLVFTADAYSAAST